MVGQGSKKGIFGHMENISLGNPLDYTQVPSPCFVLDETRLRRNMEILDDIQKRGNVKIICALKGYSFWQPERSETRQRRNGQGSPCFCPRLRR